MTTLNKIKLEFPIKASPKIIYSYLSTPTGLNDWFAEKVTTRDNIFTFHWGEEETRAKISHKRENQMVRFNWLDDEDHPYFEIEIITDEITGEVALLITDFSAPEDVDEMRMLWEQQIHDLKSIIGA